MDIKQLNRQFRIVEETDSLLDSAASLVSLATDNSYLLVRRFDGGFSVLTPPDISDLISQADLSKIQTVRLGDFIKNFEQEVVVNHHDVSLGEIRFKLKNAKNQRVVVLEDAKPVGLAQTRWMGADITPSFTKLQDQVAQLNQEVEFEVPRHVNICLVDQNRVAVSRERSLKSQSQYLLRLDIGAFSTDSAIMNPGIFPDHLLPQSEHGHWLEVICTSDDFKIPQKRFPIFLPKTGPSWVCGCQYNSDHQCEENQRDDYLFVPLISPQPRDEATIDVLIYYLNNLVQAISFFAKIDEIEEDGKGYGAMITHSLTKGLQKLNDLSESDINIKTSAHNNGKPHLVIKGEEEEVLTLLMDEAKIGTAISSARRGLENVHFESFGGKFGAKPQKENLLDKENGKARKDFINDIRELAPLGYRLFTSILADQPKKRRELPKKLLSKPTKIQVVRIGGKQIIFPWALIYDIPLESDHESHVECQLLTEWEDNKDTLTDQTKSCPYEHTHTLNTLCPFGFWGFKHAIEQPPPLPENGVLKRYIQEVDDPVEMTVGFSTELDSKLTSTHFQTLQETMIGIKLDPYKSLKDLRRALDKTALELLYFYCHGRHDESQNIDGSIVEETFLEIGKEDRVKSQDIYAWQDGLWETESHWKQISPLVFINGCHTTDLSPEALINLVDAFSYAYAAGVIGTEISLDQGLATEFAECFFSEFWDGKSIGEALNGARLKLLKKGNVLGMAYTPYCPVDLFLRKSNIPSNP